MKAKRSLKDTKTAALKNLTARKRSKRMGADVRGRRTLDVVPAPKPTKYYDSPSPY